MSGFDLDGVTMRHNSSKAPPQMTTNASGEVVEEGPPDPGGQDATSQEENRSSNCVDDNESDVFGEELVPDWDVLRPTEREDSGVASVTQDQSEPAFHVIPDWDLLEVNENGFHDVPVLEVGILELDVEVEVDQNRLEFPIECTEEHSCCFV